MFTKKPKKSLTPQRIHPLFPTPVETRATPVIAFSDHLMILTQVPLPDGTSLNIISLNILGALSCSGIHFEDTNQTEEAIKERYERMVEGLNKGIRKHQVDILAFQEAMPKFIVPALKKLLAGSWGIIKDEKTGLVTCFRTDNWVKLDTTIDEQARIRKVSLFQRKENGLLVDFHNIWGVFDEFPLSLENQCKIALTSSIAKVAIIIGDTNSRLAPLHDNEINITTGAIPLAFNQLNKADFGQQLPDYPDGGFYRSEDGVIHQLNTQVLDFVTGDIFIDRRKAREINYWPDYRMIMCLDELYKNKPVIQDKTVFEYEALIRGMLKNEQVVVRLAADCFNHKAIAIAFPNDLKDTPPVNQLLGLVSFIKDNLKNTQGFQTRVLTSNCFEKKRREFTCMFVPKAQAHLLHTAIMSAINFLPIFNWEIFEKDNQEKPVAVPARPGLFAAQVQLGPTMEIPFKTHENDNKVHEIITRLVIGCWIYTGEDPPIRHNGIIRAQSFIHLFQSTAASKTCLAIAAMALLDSVTGTKGMFGGNSKGTGLVKVLKAQLIPQDIAILQQVVTDSGLNSKTLKNIQNAIIDNATEGKYIQKDLSDIDILSFSVELAARHHINW